MKLSVTAGGFALYKESNVIGQCSVPRPQGRGHRLPVRPAPVAAEGLWLLFTERDLAPLRRL
jgi:hypothetical protein